MPDGRLNGRRIAILTANSGVEQVELTTPRQRLEAEGAATTHIAPEQGEVKAFHNDVEPGDTFTADAAISDANPDDYDALVLPGGTTNPDQLRQDPDAVAFVKAFASAGKPIAAICHGPWMLVEAGLVRGKTLTSFPSLRTDIGNAGGDWQDKEAVTDTEGWTLVTSRNPDDLDAFSDAAIAAFTA